jgi:hypothetical protein
LQSGNDDATGFDNPVALSFPETAECRPSRKFIEGRGSTPVPENIHTGFSRRVVIDTFEGGGYFFAFRESTFWYCRIRDVAVSSFGSSRATTSAWYTALMSATLAACVSFFAR